MRQMVSYHLQHSFLRKFYCHFILCYISAMEMLKISVQNSGRDFDLTQLLRRFNNVRSRFRVGKDHDISIDSLQKLTYMYQVLMRI